MAKGEKTWSLKEVDEARNASKGTAFLAFKQLKEGFDEGRDFYYLSNDQDGTELETLRMQGRLYNGTVNAVLLTETGFMALMDYLDD